jgi:hypothetical protein
MTNQPDDNQTIQRLSDAYRSINPPQPEHPDDPFTHWLKLKLKDFDESHLWPFSPDARNAFVCVTNALVDFVFRP